MASNRSGFPGCKVLSERLVFHGTNGGQPMHFNDITYVVDHGIARVTLNKPAKMNALSWGSWAEIENAIAAADADDNTKVVLITGAGRGFCAGTDLTTGTKESDWPARPLGGRPGMMRSRYLGTAS